MSETTDREKLLAMIDGLLEQSRAMTETLAALRVEVQGEAAHAPAHLFAEAFADAVAAYVRRPRVTATWETEARRLFEVDAITFEQADAVLEWLTRHHGREAAFWRRNVLSVPTFRKQWDRLVLAMRQDAERLKAGDNGRAARLLEMSRSMPARRQIGGKT